MEVKDIDFRLSMYHISDQTLYIRSAQKYNAVSEIEEIDDTYYSMQPSLKIIDQACILRGSSYTGRANAMKKLFKIGYNPPILIDEHQDLYTFATRSPHHEDCIWIFTKNIIRIEHGDKYSIIHFKGNKTLRVRLSKRRLERLCSYLYKIHSYFNKNNHA